VAKYHFYIDGDLADLNQDGEEFGDDDAARSSALRAFGEMLRDERVLLRSGSFSISVTDEQGRSVIRLTAEATLERSD
jgi:hypothetical protein